MGNAILSQVSLHLSASGDLDDIIALINTLLANIEAMKEESDAFHAQARASCNRLIPEYSNKMAYHAEQRDICQNIVNETTDLRAEAMTQLDNTIAELISVNARIEEGTATREDEHARYELLMAEHDSGIAACQEAVSLISSLGAGGSFIQLKGRIKAVGKKLADMTHLDAKFQAYAPLITSLTELANSATPGAVQQIVQLLSALRAQIENTRAADDSWEQERKTMWDNELTDLTNQRDNLTKKRNNLSAAIENYTSIIDDNQEKYEINVQDVERFKYLLEDTTANCDAEQTKYDHDTAVQ